MLDTRTIRKIDTILADMNGQGAAVKLTIVDASRRNPYERRFRSGAEGYGRGQGRRICNARESG